MAFSLFGKKDEPQKKNEPAAKSGPATVAPAAKPGTSAPAKPAVTPPAPKPLGGVAKPAAAKSAPPAVSHPPDDDDLDFTAPPSAARPATGTPAPPSKAAPAATKPAAAPIGDLFADLAAKVAQTPTAAPAAKQAAAPAAKPVAAPAATQPAAVAAKQAAPAPNADLAPLDPGTLGTAKSGAPTFEKTWMPEGRKLAPEKPPTGKVSPSQEAVAPARPRGSASAGPSAPPAMTAATGAKPPVAPVSEVKHVAPPASAATGGAPAAQKAATPAPAAKVEAPSPPIEVSEPELAVPPAIEQAAVMFANGQTDAAISALKTAIDGAALGGAAAQAWLMLFDLHQLQGRRDQHDALALEFVVKFERSAPAWRDEPKETAKDPALERGTGAYFALTGELSAASAGEIEQLQKTAEKGPLLRIDFGKLTGVDAEGAKRLLDALKTFGKSRRELVLTSHKTLVDLLAAITEVGRKEDPQVYWLLLLELNQVLGLQVEFDDVALNFAITYELSPPAFEERAKPAKAEAASAASADADDAIVMTGEICGSDDDELARLAKTAAAREDVVIDMAQLKRVDFVAAGTMLKTITGLAAAGKAVRIRAANELIGALFQVVGITRYATLIKRR